MQTATETGPISEPIIDEPSIDTLERQSAKVDVEADNSGTLYSRALHVRPPGRTTRTRVVRVVRRTRAAHVSCDTHAARVSYDAHAARVSCNARGVRACVVRNYDSYDVSYVMHVTRDARVSRTFRGQWPTERASRAVAPHVRPRSCGVRVRMHRAHDPSPVRRADDPAPVGRDDMPHVTDPCAT